MPLYDGKKFAQEGLLQVAQHCAQAVLHAPQLIGKTEIFVAYVLACIFPDRFSIIAYALGMVCFVMTGSLVASAGSRDK